MLSPGTVKGLTSKYLSLTPTTFAALSSPTPCALLPLSNLCANSCSCIPRKTTFLLPWRWMQRKASDVSHLNSSRKGSETFISCVFYFYFPNPLQSFGTEICPSSKGISLRQSYYSLRTPLTPTRN